MSLTYHPAEENRFRNGNGYEVLRLWAENLFNCSEIRPPNGLWKTSSQPLRFVAAIRSLVCQINDWFLHISSI